jgi:hypothetical protein
MDQRGTVTVSTGRFDKLKVPSLSRDTCVDPLRRRRPELLGHAE